MQCKHGQRRTYDDNDAFEEATMEEALARPVHNE